MKFQLHSLEPVGPRVPEATELLNAIPQLLSKSLVGRDDRLLLRLAVRAGFTSGMSLEMFEGGDEFWIRRSYGHPGALWEHYFELRPGLRRWLWSADQPLQALQGSSQPLAALLPPLRVGRLTLIPLGDIGERRRLFILGNGPELGNDAFAAIRSFARVVAQASDEQAEGWRLRGENTALREQVGTVSGWIPIEVDGRRALLEELEGLLEATSGREEDLLRIAGETLASSVGGHVLALWRPQESRLAAAYAARLDSIDVEPVLQRSLARVGETDFEGADFQLVQASLPVLPQRETGAVGTLVSAPSPWGDRLIWLNFHEHEFGRADSEMFDRVASRVLFRIHSKGRGSTVEAAPVAIPVAAPRPNHLVEESLEQLDHGVLLISPRNEVLALNAQGRKTLSWTGPPPTALSALDADTGLDFKALIELVRAGAMAHHGEDLQRRDGTTVHVTASLVGEDGAVLLSLSDGLSDSAGVRRHVQLVESIAHDLKTPLSTMRTAVQLLLQEQPGPNTPEQVRFLSMTLRNIDRLTRMVSGLLDISRQQAGELLLSREEGDMSRLLGPLLHEYASTAQQKGRMLAWAIDHGAGAYADADRLQRILDNVVGNAIKFTEPGGHVLVSVRKDQERPKDAVSLAASKLGNELRGICVDIEDDGRGMSEAVVERAFDRFFMGGPVVEGTNSAGLGLAITQALVDAHQGCIGIQSEPDDGTKVSIWLPARQQEADLAACLRELEHDLDRARRHGKPARLAVIEAEGLGEDAREVMDQLARVLHPTGGPAWRVLRPHEAAVATILPAEVDFESLLDEAVLQVPGLLAAPGALRFGTALHPKEGIELPALLSAAVTRSAGRARAARSGSDDLLSHDEEVSP